MSTRVAASLRKLQRELETARPRRRYMSFAAFVVASMPEDERPEGWERMGLSLDVPPSPKLAAMIAASTAPAGADAVMPVRAEPQQPGSPEPVITVETREREITVRERITRTTTVAPYQPVHPRVSPQQVVVLHGDDRLRPGDLLYSPELDGPDRRGVGKAATERDGSRWR